MLFSIVYRVFYVDVAFLIVVFFVVLLEFKNIWKKQHLRSELELMKNELHMTFNEKLESLAKKIIELENQINDVKKALVILHKKKGRKGRR